MPPRRTAVVLRSAGVACAVTAGLVACSGEPGAQPPRTTTSATTSAAAGSLSSPSPVTRSLAITVTGKRVTPAPARVTIKAGETLRLTVTSDHDDELHAHGFNVEATLTAGQPTTVTLTGSAPGLYDVETHHPELRLLQVLVQ